MELEDLKKIMTKALKAAFEGGKAIMDVYESDFAVEHKEDKSPLTLADKNANDVIVAELKDTMIPVLSEEGRSIEFGERSLWEYFWMVDPLDGTKEFVKRNGEFTVNIALINNGEPIAGVIYVPVKSTLYISMNGLGAFKVENYKGEDLKTVLSNGLKLPISSQREDYIVVASRSHLSEETAAFIEEMKTKHEKVNMVSMGSSLKICLVAEGVADVYPRYAPTMEWDTAAGHAIAIGAGKNIIDFETGKQMLYNKERLLNNWFTVK